MKKILFLLILPLLFIGCEQEQGLNSEFAGGDGQGGSLATFALKGDYLYVVDRYDLNVFDIKNPSNPVQVNTVHIGFNIETLFGFKNYLYIGSQNGMFIYSIEQPTEPQQLSSVQHFTACDPVIANDSIAFVTLHSNTFCGNATNQLEVYDVTKTTRPILLTTRNMDYPKGIGLFRNYLLVCDDKIEILDVTQPAQPILVNEIDVEAFDLIIKNNLLIAIGSDGLYQYELFEDGNTIAFNNLSSIVI